MVNMIMIMILFLPGKGALLVVRERSGQRASRRHGSERSPAVLVNISLHCNGMRILTYMQPLWPGVFCLRYEIWTMYNVKSWYDYHDRVCLVTIFVQLWWWYHLENTMHYICQTSPASLVWIFLKSQQPPWSGTGPLREPPTPCTQWLKRGGKEKVHVQVKTLRLLHVFVWPRQWTDHLRHVINSAPPAVPFDTPVNGMEKATETVLV